MVVTEKRSLSLANMFGAALLLPVVNQSLIRLRIDTAACNAGTTTGEWSARGRTGEMCRKVSVALADADVDEEKDASSRR